VLLQIGIDLAAEFFDLGPLFFGVRLGDAGRLEEARDRHFKAKFAFAFIHRAADGRGALRIGRGSQWDMAFARHQAGSGVESDPAGARQVHFAPGVEVGEILFRAAGAVERFDIGRELNEIAADKSGRQSAMAQQLDHAARPSRGTSRWPWRGFLPVFARQVPGG
jgi:hypothetical protein